MRLTARFFVIVASVGFSFLSPVSSGSQTDFRTELHEENRSRVARTTVTLFRKINSPVPFVFSLLTHSGLLTDLRYHQKLKIFDRIKFDPPARIGHHPRMAQEHHASAHTLQIRS